MLKFLRFKKGIGIVEIILSTVILVIAAGAGTMIVVHAKSSTYKSLYLTQATFFTSSIVEDLIRYRYTDLDSSLLPIPVLPNIDLKNKAQGTCSYTIKEYDSLDVEINPIDHSGDYKVIEVTTTWNGTKSVVLTFYKYA